MEQVIIFNLEDRLAICYPDNEKDINEIAKIVVPSDVPYLIVKSEEIPLDIRFSEAWEADFSDPDGYGADYGPGYEKEVIGWNEDGKPVIGEQIK